MLGAKGYGRNVNACVWREQCSQATGSSKLFKSRKEGGTKRGKGLSAGAKKVQSGGWIFADA